MRADRDTLISDSRIREILKSFGTLLHQSIKASATFGDLEYGFDGSKAVPMSLEEIDLWDQNFQIRNYTTTQAEQGLIYVQADAEDKSTEPFEIFSWGSPHIVPMVNLDPEGVNYFITPLASLRGRSLGNFEGMPLTFGGEGLDSAMLGLQIRTEDSKGRGAYSQLLGTRPGSRILGVDTPLTAQLMLNTTVNPKEPNTLEPIPGHPQNFFAKCKIHDIPSLDSLPIPSDPEMRLFFWQMDRLLPRNSLGQINPRLVLG